MINGILGGAGHEVRAISGQILWRDVGYSGHVPPGERFLDCAGVGAAGSGTGGFGVQEGSKCVPPGDGRNLVPGCWLGLLLDDQSCA